MRGFKRGGDVCAGAETRINEILRAQPVERFGINSASLRLEENRFSPLDAKPLEVFEYGIDEFGSASGLIKILDPKQPMTLAIARPRGSENRAKSVSQMQPSGRRRSETRDLHLRPP